MKIEAVIVDGVVYDVVKTESNQPCHDCAFDQDPKCVFACGCICAIDEHLKRREMK